MIQNSRVNLRSSDEIGFRRSYKFLRRSKWETAARHQGILGMRRKSRFEIRLELLRRIHSSEDRKLTVC